MYIGLIDDDLRARSVSYPNLEIMKLSSFHKKNRDLVELVQDYRTYTRYSKLYLRKNKENDDLPALFLSKARDKSEYGGYAFTNGIYVPMDEAIEKSLPDVTIYDKIINDKRISEAFKRNLKRVNIRLQTAESLPDLSSSMGCLIHDKKAFQFPLFREVVERSSIINFVYPLEFDNLEEAVIHATQKKYMSGVEIKYDGIITSSMAKEISSQEFKNKIKYQLISDKYKDVNFYLGLDLIEANMSKIENVCRYSRYLVPQCPFNNIDLKNLFEIMTGSNITDKSIESKINFMLKQSSRDILYSRHKNLVNRIKIIRRYGTYGQETN